MTLYSLLMALLVLAVVLYLITFLPNNKLRTFIQVIVILIALVWLLRGLFGLPL